MKYLETSDAIIISTPEKMFQIKVGSDEYNRIKKVIATNKSPTLQELGLMNLFNYEDDDITITQEIDSDKAEVYYNGKYYDIPSDLVNNSLTLLKKSQSFKIDFVVNLIKRVLSNPYYTANSLFQLLQKINFDFIADGRIITTKAYEEESIGHYNRKRLLGTPAESIKKTYILIDPSEIINDSIKVYFVLGSYLAVNSINILNSTYINDNYKTLVKCYEECDNSSKDEVTAIKRMEDILQR